MRLSAIHTGPGGYLILGAWVFAEQIGLPLPATPALLAAGALAAAGRLNAAVVVATAVAASVLADYLLFRAGALGGDAVNRFLRRHGNSNLLRNWPRPECWLRPVPGGRQIHSRSVIVGATSSAASPGLARRSSCCLIVLGRSPGWASRLESATALRNAAAVAHFQSRLSLAAFLCAAFLPFASLRCGSGDGWAASNASGPWFRQSMPRSCILMTKFRID